MGFLDSQLEHREGEPVGPPPAAPTPPHGDPVAPHEAPPPPPAPEPTPDPAAPPRRDEED